MAFETFIWSKLASYYQQNDTLKDDEGKGLLQRYLSVFGLDLDENTIPAIQGLIDNLNPETALNDYLTLIAYSLGSPSDILGDQEAYADLLVQVISMYQIKGTFRSYQQLFALLGMTVTIEELFPADNEYDGSLSFDSGALYESISGGLYAQYDNDGCQQTCIHYNLYYDNLPGKTIAPLTDDMQTQLRALITSLIEPHSAELNNLTYTPPIS